MPVESPIQNAVRILPISARAEHALAKLDLSSTALICLSSIDMKTPAHVHYAARRLKNRAPHAKFLLGVWSVSDEKALNDLKEAVNADYVARTFHQAAAIIREYMALTPMCLLLSQR